MIAITIFSVLVSSTMSAVLKDGQATGSALRFTQQNKNENFAYAIPERRLGIIPAIFQIPEMDPQSEYVYFEAPTSIPHIYKQAHSPSKLQIINIQEIPIIPSSEKMYKLRESLPLVGMLDRESYKQMARPSGSNERLESYIEDLKQSTRENLGNLQETKSYIQMSRPSSTNERLESYIEELKQISQRNLEKLQEKKKNHITANLFRQANFSQMMEYGEEVPEVENYQQVIKGLVYDGNSGQVKTISTNGGMIPGPWNENQVKLLGGMSPGTGIMNTEFDAQNNKEHDVNQVKPFSGITPGTGNMNGEFDVQNNKEHDVNQVKPFSGITPGTVNSGNMNSEFDSHKEHEYVDRGDINRDLSTESGFVDTMGRVSSGKDVPEAEGYNNNDDELKVKSLESILKLIGGGKNSAWVKKAEAAPVRVEATDYRTNFSEEMCSLWPENLQWSAKAVRASLLVAQDMADVKTFAKNKFLGLHVENITESAKEASFHIVLAIDLRGAPVARAVRSAQKAVGAAVAGSEAALRAATEYATSPGARFAQLVLKAAQRADDAAQIAKDIIRNVNLND